MGNSSLTIMKAISVLLLTVLSSVSAFLPSAPLRATPSVKAVRSSVRSGVNMALKVEDMPGIGPETGNRVFDPLGLSKSGDLGWYRACELRHGRTAMLAVIGWIATKAGILTFGDFAKDTAAVDVWGPDQFWNTVPDAYKFAFFAPIFIVEWACESQKPHYTQTDTPGQFPQFVPDLSGNKYSDPKKLLDMQNKELKNGRLAMIGIMSFLAAEAIPGSVPAYPW